MIRKLLDLCFPPLCELCGELQSDGVTLCKPCFDKLPRIEQPYCIKCGEEFPGVIDEEFSCPNCTDIRLDFDFARSPLSASLGARQLIHSLKYRSRFYLADDLARFFTEMLESEPRLSALPKNTCVIPVPMHWIRHQRRQGNQAHELAQSFCKLTGKHFSPALKRVHHTQTQTRLTRKQRLTNLKNAFAIRPKFQKDLTGATILLIDDVFTTGSTAHECSRLLKKEGKVESVIILTLVRG